MLQDNRCQLLPALACEVLRQFASDTQDCAWRGGGLLYPQTVASPNGPVNES